MVWCWSSRWSFMTLIPRKAIRYEFPLATNRNLSLQRPVPPKPLFQLLICLLLLGAFSHILVTTSFQSSSGCIPFSSRTCLCGQTFACQFERFGTNGKPRKAGRTGSPMLETNFPPEGNERNFASRSICKEGLGWVNQLDLGNSMQLLAGSNHPSNTDISAGENMAFNSSIWSIAILIETQKPETVANGILMAHEKPERKKAPRGNWPGTAAELVQTTMASQKLLWWSGGLKCSDAAGGMNSAVGLPWRRFKLNKLFLQAVEPYGLRHETFKIFCKALKLWRANILQKTWLEKQFGNIPPKYMHRWLPLLQPSGIWY